MDFIIIVSAGNSNTDVYSTYHHEKESYACFEGVIPVGAIDNSSISYYYSVENLFG